MTLSHRSLLLSRIYTDGSTLETLQIEGPTHQVSFLLPRFGAYDLHEATLVGIFQVAECVTAYVFLHVFKFVSFREPPPPKKNYISFFQTCKIQTALVRTAFGVVFIYCILKVNISLFSVK